MESKFSLPTEMVELPSKGLLYPEDSPLSSGMIEMKYMTAKEEDLLTNQNYIRSGTVIDKLMKSLIVDKTINYKDILIGDKNALMFAARVLSYGKDYEFIYDGIEQTVDLSTLELKYIDEDKVTGRANEFTFKLPSTDNTVTYKLLTHGDEFNIESEIAGLKKIHKGTSPESTTRLKRMITSVNGSREVKDIREFVDNYLLARDARALRAEYQEVQPDIIMKAEVRNQAGGEEDVDIPINLNFFWPDSGI
jgi:hypothetical protein